MKFNVLAFIVIGVEPPVAAGALFLVGLPFTVWIDTIFVSVVLVLGVVAQVLPPITGVVIWIPVHVVFVGFRVAAVDMPCSVLAGAFVVTCVTFTPPVLETVSIQL